MMTNLLPMAAIVLIARLIDEPILGMLAVVVRVLWWAYWKAGEKE